MKKGVFIFGILFLFLINLISSASDFSPDDLIGVDREQIEDIRDLSEDVQKWDYLSNEWKKILQNNPIISPVDSFLRKIDFVFVFFTGESYEFSLTFLFVIIFWVFFFSNLNIIFRDYSTFSKEVALVLAIAFSSILGQIQHTYANLAKITFKFIFFKEGIWGWAGVIVFIVILCVLSKFIKSFGKKMVAKKELQAKEQEKIDRKILRNVAKNFGKIFTKK